MGWMDDETGLDKTAANYVPLTPLSHLARAVRIAPERTALVYRGARWTYAEHVERVTRLASALAQRGIAPGDVVATILPNVPAQVEATWAVPACSGVLNAINTRLDPDTVRYILTHGRAKIAIVDSAAIEMTEAALVQMDGPLPLIVEVPDAAAGIGASGRHMTYEKFIAEGDPAFRWIYPADEWESLALNYTSGTTGRPKGVVYHHRGAYLATMGNLISWRMQLYPVYLTIVPLFHCNAWTHPWMVPLLLGTTVCCRDITASTIYDAIADEGVTHFGGAPIVLNAIVNADDADRRDFDHIVEVFTAGAPPPAATLKALEPLGFNVTQVYGLTEVYGPATDCTWKPDWDDLEPDARAEVKARTGIVMPMMEEITVLGENDAQVPWDGETTGEIVMRGNATMKGYYKNPEATAEAFKGGWFRTGDIAFQHDDGYIKITDRSKDIIISGGENVSSVEVESTLMHHPAVSLCAVVAKPDDKWGEVPCAFVELKGGQDVSEAELIGFCRERLAGFKTPKHILFEELPKTSTGKIQKFALRARAKDI